MNRLPETWTSTNILNLAKWYRGVTYSRSDAHDKPGESLIGILRATNITETGLSLDDLVYVPRRLVTQEQIIKAGDVVIATSSGSINVVGKAQQSHTDIDASFGAFCALLRPNSGIDSRYFGHFFGSSFYRATASSLALGININNLKSSDFEQIEIPLPPLNEQKRIADKLDTLLARVDACRAHLERVPDLLKRFRQAVLSAAVSGQLTKDWRNIHHDKVSGISVAEKLQEAHNLAGGHKAGNAAPATEGVHDIKSDWFPKGWYLLELRELVRPDRPITYGILKPGPDTKEGVPYIRVADYPNDQLNLDNIRRTTTKIDQEFSRSRLENGDILLSIRGTVGRVVVIPNELHGSNITQDSARLSIQPYMSRDFVVWYLRSEFARKRMDRAIKGVAVRGINIGDVRALQVPIPSYYEQTEIVRRVEALFAYADRLENHYQAAYNRVDTLTSALLAKAFRGELVPQDPKDEPAEALLERIHAARIAQSQEKQSRPQIEVVTAEVKVPPRKNEERMVDVSQISPSHLTDILKDRGPQTPEALWNASGLGIEDFYDQLKDEELRGLLRELRDLEDDLALVRKIEAIQ